MASTCVYNEGKSWTSLTSYVFIILILQNICSMNGWKAGSDKHTFVQKLFAMLWRKLQDDADRDFDGVVTDQEWVKNKLVVFVTLPSARFLVKKHFAS